MCVFSKGFLARGGGGCEAQGGLRFESFDPLGAFPHEPRASPASLQKTGGDFIFFFSFLVFKVFPFFVMFFPDVFFQVIQVISLLNRGFHCCHVLFPGDL